tara:strand:- start:12 stop:200 length:189 start_codon:yes stop_codon:yes gene_type:complete
LIPRSDDAKNARVYFEVAIVDSMNCYSLLLSLRVATKNKVANEPSVYVGTPERYESIAASVL